MNGLAVDLQQSECSECARASRGPDSSELESVESLLAKTRELSERLLRRQQLDNRSEWRMALALSLSLLDAVESARDR
jgi:hypothetical protein